MGSSGGGGRRCAGSAHIPCAATGSSRSLDLQHDRRVAPEALELVEVALLGHERVHDDVAEIDEDPPPRAVALDADRRAPGGLRLLHDAGRHGLDLSLAAAAAEDEEVRDRGDL